MNPLKVIIKELKEFRLCGPGDDPDEQLGVTAGYRRLLTQLKILAAPHLSEAQASQLNAINVEYNDIYPTFRTFLKGVFEL